MARLSRRSFAIVPAAGRSRRMGRHKLTLPFGRTTVIEQVLHAWQASCVNEVVVIVRRGDHRLRTLCGGCGAQLVTPPQDPAEMKDSILYGLAYIRDHFSPQAEDVWLLAPADGPRLSSAVINLLLANYDRAGQSIAVPTHHGRRGHPVLFPWRLAAEVSQLADNEGVNALLRRHAIQEVPCGEPSVLDDLDTPDDYRRLHAE